MFHSLNLHSIRSSICTINKSVKLKSSIKDSSFFKDTFDLKDEPNWYTSSSNLDSMGNDAYKFLDIFIIKNEFVIGFFFSIFISCISSTMESYNINGEGILCYRMLAAWHNCGVIQCWLILSCICCVSSIFGIKAKWLAFVSILY